MRTATSMMPEKAAAESSVILARRLKPLPLGESDVVCTWCKLLGMRSCVSSATEVFAAVAVSPADASSGP